MKKYVSLAVLAVLCTPAFGASAVPSHITKDNKGGYDVTYSYKDKAKSGWYVTGRAELSFLNFKNKYNVNAENLNLDKAASEDKFSFKPVFGGSLAGGKRINYFWRAELEGGYLGYFEDEDSAAKFSMSLPYLMANGYYDFTNGLYVGAGVGASLAQYKLSGSAYFVDFKKDKTVFAPMVGLMAGYSHKLDDNLVLDLRYRLSAMTGAELKTRVEVVDNDTGESHGYTHFKSKTGMVLDNSISLGLRYEF